jgi:gliding motility-associated-like protein
MRKFFLLVVILLISLSTKATHIVGGEITYVYLGANTYKITLIVYRDCSPGTSGFDNPVHITIFDTLGTVLQNINIPFPGAVTLPNNANNPCLIVPPNVCVEEATYETTVVLPPIVGGYNIAWQRCCRNGTILNIQDPINTGSSYLTHIPGLFAFQNNSPKYNQFPPTVVCSGYPLSFNHSATDNDGDSLVYSLCAPYIGGSPASANPNPEAPPPYNLVTFINGYSALNPIGGNPQLAINPASGLLTATPIDIGQFVVGVCVKEYRNGILLSENKRDFQFNVTSCSQSVQAITTPSIINCSNLVVNFPNSSVGGQFYHWNFGVPSLTNDTSNLFAPTYTYPDTGVYTATLIVNPGTICSDTATTTVTIYPTLTAAMIAPDGCSGNDIQFYDQSVSTYGFVNNWVWNFGDFTNNSLINNPTHTFNNAGTYTVTLIVTTNLGCKDTIQEQVIMLTGPITNTFGDTTVCKLDYVGIGVDAIGTYQWAPNYQINDINTAYPIVNPQVTTTYFVTATSPDGCIEKDSVVITVFDTVIAVLSSDTALCPGQCVNLSGLGGLYYSWSPATGLNATNQPFVTSCPPSTQVYSFTTWVGSCSDTKSVTVQVLPLPTLSLDDNVNLCKGDSVLLQPFGCTNYSWSPPTGLSATDIPNPWAFPNTTTTYTVTATNANSCPVVLKDSIIVNVIINPYTVAPETTIILGTSVSIYANGGANYFWTPGETLSNTNTPDPVASPTATTTYYVTIIFPDGCKAYDSVIVRVDPNPIINFPNAFTPNGDGKNDRFRPQYKGLLDVEYFRVYNRWGQLLYESTNISEGWDGTFKGLEQEVGTYVYLFGGKSTVGQNPIQQQGNFTLMR